MSYTEALRLFREGLYAEAKPLLLEPSDHHRFMLAQCELFLGDSRRALELFHACSLTVPNAYTFIAKLTSEPELYLKRGAALKDPECAYELGLLYYGTSKPLRAVKYFNMVLDRCTTRNGEVFYALGALYLKTPKQRAKGVSFLECAVLEGYESATDLLEQLTDLLRPFRKGSLKELKKLVAEEASADNHFALAMATETKLGEAFLNLDKAAALQHAQALSLLKTVTEFV